jgi:lactoylglutathione lyase
MKTPFLGLRTTIYKVDDIKEATAWYTKAFGVKPYFDEPFYVGFNIGGYELGLQPEEKPATPKTANVESYWGVEKIEAVFQHLLDHGASVHEAPQDVGGGIKVATVKDPWQNVIGIIFNPHFKLI